jgi:hypothetical protein
MVGVKNDSLNKSGLKNHTMPRAMSGRNGLDFL